MSSQPHTWPRLYARESLSENGFITLNPEQSRYLIQVMRSQSGDPTRIFNGLDGEYLAEIQDVPKSKKRGLTLKIGQNYRKQAPAPNINLYAAPIKRAHFEFLVMKATELGVRAIQPILTERTQIKDIKRERLHTIAIEAAEQSERLTIPQIHDPLTLSEVTRRLEADRLPILCAEFGQAQPAASALSGSLAQKSPKAGIFTGPEGGFTEDEMNIFKKLPKTLPIRLGPRILRADTAAIAALTCWQALCGDWQAPDGEGITHEIR